MSSHVTDAPDSGRKPHTLVSLRQMHARKEPISMLTAYDSSFGRLADLAGIDTILVGDSLGMVMQGHSSTVPVTIEQACYHVTCVTRGNKAAWLVGDLPFGSYHESIEQGIRSAVQLMQAGAQMVKLEGGGWTAEVIHALTQRGIPVCAHLGLTPQSVHAIGGYRIQGKDDQSAQVLMAQAREVADAGAAMLVMELMPSAVAARVSASIPDVITIGIGAGKGVSGQVLVMHDMLGVTVGKLPRFVRNFMQGQPDVLAAFRAYHAAVKDGSFPDEAQHGY